MQRLRNYLLQLNLFGKSSSTAQTTAKECLATRIYLCLLITSLLLVTVVSTLIVRTVDRVESTPSLARFLLLSSLYSATLQCPCSKYGISFNSFVIIHAHFHQVCSSDFIQQTWIDSIYHPPNHSAASLDDIRPMLSFFWKTIAGLCEICDQTWNQTLSDFTASYLLTPIATDEPLLRSQVQAALNTQITLARATLSRNLLAIRQSISGNQLVSALTTNFFLRRSSTDTNQSTVLKMSPRSVNKCSCLNNKGCPRPANVIDDSHKHSIIIPGMMVDCLMVDGTFSSTLECYYQSTCFSLLHPPSSSINIQLLSDTTNKHFSPNDSVQRLLDEMMIDQIIQDIHLDSFYSQCNPSSCSYSYSQRFNALYSFTILIGVFGGLSTLLRVVAVLLAEGILRRRNRHSPGSGVIQAATAERCQSLLRLLRQQMIILNLFERKTARTSHNILHETRLTRLFILIFTLSSIIVTLYIVLVQQNHLITVPSPSISVYQQLLTDHSDTLQCPCSHISVSYDHFINLSFVLHQVCSSDWIFPAWLDFVTSFDPTLLPLWTETPFARDFRTVGASYFQLLATFCSLAQTTIEDAQRVFTQTHFVNDRLLSPSLFLPQTEYIIDSFINTTADDFKRTFEWIQAMFFENYFLTGSNINVDITIDEIGQVKMDEASLQLASEITHHAVSLYGYCTCSELSQGCSIQSVIFTNATNFFEFEQVFYELHIGCTPLWGFFNSKINWWYNSTYLINIYQTYAIITDIQSPPMITNLNASVPSRFQDVLMQDLLSEMLLERWINTNASFEHFYAACAPLSCSYTIVQRRSILVISLLLISICSGLNRGLRLLVLLIGAIIVWILDRWRYRDTAHVGQYLRHLDHLQHWDEKY